ncbi:MAG: amino acid permease [Streptococcaceae bacterium]|jgi:L-asparagine transporter-like permease|nr:amino acid permease [Streptococcaceae bacterium]
MVKDKTYIPPYHETHPSETEGENRGLKNRHIQLIAIAGTIGTGLFMGAGKSISLTGPSILLVYLFIGGLMFVLLRAIGSMLYMDPSQHSFLSFVFRYIGPRTGYFIQWTYWLVVIFMAMAELTAIGSYLQYWLPNVPLWVTEPLILVVLFGLNTLNAKFFGETEFWFGMIKIIAIGAMILTAIILLVTHFDYNSVQHYTSTSTGKAVTMHAVGSASLSNIFSGFSLFPNGGMNFIASFQMVMFAFVAMEFIGMTAAETANPRPTLKKAIHQIPYRILIFYIGALLAIMSIITWHDIPADASPFVMVFQLIGVTWAASLVNFVVLTSASSALNSALFSTSRNLYSLSVSNGDKALKPFTKLSKNGIPLNALIFTALLIFLTPFITLIPGVANAFVAVTAIATNLFLIVYVVTLITYLRYRRSPEFVGEVFKTPWILIPVTIVFFILIFLSLFFFKDTAGPAIGAVIWVIVFGLVSFFRKPALETEKA